MDRRIAVVASGLEAHDSRYVADPFRDALDGRALILGESLLRQACRFAAMSADELLIESTELLSCFSPDEPDAERQLRAIAEMLIRQSRTVLQAVTRERAKGGCEPASTSLLGLFGAQPLPEPSASLETRAPWHSGLSDGAQSQFEKHRLKSSLRIEIRGHERRRTAVAFDDHEALLTDAEFVLFLRLVIGVFEKGDGDGYEPLGDEEPARRRGAEVLAPVGLAHEDWARTRKTVESAVGDVCDRVGTWLGGLRVRDFIQTDARRVRLSTVPELISFDLDQLDAHPNADVKCLAKRLRAAAEKIAT